MDGCLGACERSKRLGVRWGGWGPDKHSLGLPAPQLEKVLQQGDISECCEPYMVMKEVDTAKVIGWRLDLVVRGPPAGPILGSTGLRH